MATNDPLLESQSKSLGIVTLSEPAPTETFIRAHIERMSPGSVALVTLDGPGDFNVNQPVLRLPCPNVRHALLRKVHVLLRLVRGDYACAWPPESVSRLESFVQHHGIQFFLCEYGHIATLFAPLFVKLGIPFSVYFHGFDASRLLRSWKWRVQYRRLGTDARWLITPSQHLANSLCGIGISRARIRVIPYGVDADRFAPSSDARDGNLVLAVGRLVAKKAPSATIQAFARATQNRPHLRLEIVGDGPLRGECESLVDGLGLNGRVIFHGVRDSVFICGLMKRAALFVQHSVQADDGDTEGLPVAILEALASGLPLVATSHAGIPECVIDGENGFLVPEHDVEAMASRIGELSDNRSQREQFGAAAREFAVRHYNQNDRLSELKALLCEN